jgi:hypothetical protein
LDQLRKRDGFHRQNNFSSFDNSEIEDFLDQIKQVPARFEYLVDALLLVERRRWRAQGSRIKPR